MSRRRVYSYSILAVSVFFIWISSGSNEKHTEEFSEKVKVSFREAGNQLLLSNQDATSLILPVVAINDSKYRLAFQHPLSFEPGSLVSAVDKSFQKLNLPKNYRIEVIQCTDQEVAYSYEMNSREEKTIIPCAGRFLPESCYTIEVGFIAKGAFFNSKQTLLYILVFIVFLLMEFFFFKRKKPNISEENSSAYAAIGSFRFYPEQNKLVKEAVEISLSKKECELLAIFVANPNQIIKRDELTKKVWEDNGVFVGRSLDTYISKLRKKLQDDDSIKLTNLHGVGYKLEVK